MANNELLPPPVLSAESLISELQKVAAVDVSKNRIATWWNRGQVAQIAKLTAEKLAAAKNIRELSAVQHETLMAEVTAQARIEVERLLLHNQAQVITEATTIGVLPAEYSQYSLAKLQAQLQVEVKELQVKDDLRLERATLEETYKAVLAKMSVEFDQRRQLIDEIAKWETDLETVDNESLTPTAKRNKKKRLRREIKLAEAKLASQSQIVQTGNGRRPRPNPETQADPEGPEESA